MEQISNTEYIAGSDIICIEGNGARPSHRGTGWKVGGAMYTLNSTEVHCVCYAIGLYCSEGVLSSNPHSGFYETELARTLDAVNCGCPGCNQGGTAVIEIHSAGTQPDGFQDKDNKRRYLPDLEPPDGYRGGNVPLILVIDDETNAQPETPDRSAKDCG